VRILVTGHTGLVGGAVFERLAGEGHDVVGASRRSSPAVDLGEPDAAASALRELGPFDAVVHAAASLDPASPQTGTVNRAGTGVVVAAAEEWGAALAFVSGVTVIGAPRRIPIDEDHPTDPANEYLASKLDGERIVADAAGRGLRAASLRVTAPIGTAMPRTRILGAFVLRALRGEPLELVGQGTRRQDYVDVRDVAAATAAWLERGPAGVFNVGSGRSVSNMGLAQTVVETLGSSSAIRFAREADPADRVHWDVSIARAREAFGYEPTVALEASVRDIAAAWSR
jgi:UDP-glucose 4-epimerase